MCKKCGFNKPGSENFKNIRRSLSEESLGAAGMERNPALRSGGGQDPYNFMRRRRIVYPKPVFYDEQVIVISS